MKVRIDSEIERIRNEYIRTGTAYKYSDSVLLRADGALRELYELKRKINE